MNIQQRNDAAKQYVLDMLDKAALASEVQFQSLPSFAKTKDILTTLIFQQARGFRGVVATALTGIHLNPSYQPLKDFYGCNPRAIFEQGIYYAFQERKVPCGKSDPLNVAKNESNLSYAWAKGKRPQAAAEAVVDFLKYLEQLTIEEKVLATEYFFFILLEYANFIASISNATLPIEDSISSQQLSSKISEFIDICPESGTIPQKVIALLLIELYRDSSIVVHGGDESVFGTNTTSRKPADIWLSKDNKPFNLFEITVKKVDHKRLDDALESITNMNLAELPLTFICRILDDIKELDVNDDALQYKGKLFNFVDIDEFISVCMSQLSIQGIENLMSKLVEFVNQHDRPPKTKEGWARVFAVSDTTLSS